MSPKQAVLFFNELKVMLVLLLRRQVFSAQLFPSQRYVYATDFAFCFLEVFAGDRASDESLR